MKGYIETQLNFFIITHFNARMELGFLNHKTALFSRYNIQNYDDALVKHKVIQPSEDLRNIVNAYWYLKISSSSQVEKEMFIPNGTVALIIRINCSFISEEVGKNEKRILKTVFMTQKINASILSPEPSKDLEVFVIFFHPEILASFKKQSMRELTCELFYTGSEIFGSLSSTLEEIANSHSDIEELLNNIEMVLRKSCLYSTENIWEITKARKAIMISHGMNRIDSIAEEIELHYKKLQRLFTTHVGMTPKEYSSSIRFYAAFNYLIKHPESEIFDTAIRFGYHDTSHFSKEFNALVGCTPGNLVQSNRTQLTTHILKKSS